MTVSAGRRDNRQGTWIDKKEEMKEISEGRRKAMHKEMRNPEDRDFLPLVMIRGSQSLALPEQVNLCPREGEKQEVRLDGASEVEGGVG